MKKYLLFTLCLPLSLGVFAATAAADDDGMAAAREALQTDSKSEAADNVPLRDTVITAKHMEYNRKENVAVLTEDVVIDDARFNLTADRIYVFLENQAEEGDGTEKAEDKNVDATVMVGDEESKQSFSQIVCLGNVHVKSENRRATCDKAVYTRVDACLVLVGHASLTDVNEEGKSNTISGDKITIWTEEERIEVYPNPTLRLAPGSSKNVKDFM